MKRFFVCGLLLLLTLLLARAVDASVFEAEAETASARSSWRVEANFSSRSDCEGARSFFDHRIRSRPEEAHRIWRRDESDRNRPARVEDQIRFRYRDRGYSEVVLLGSFADWEPLSMELDSKAESWEVHRSLPAGRHQYVFVVRYDDGRQRDRVDPSHSRRTKLAERGWVSELEVQSDGSLEETVPRHAPSRRKSYELDLATNFGLDYQRVDGWMFSFGPSFDSPEPWAPALDTFLGYGFKSERWSTRLSFVQPLTPDRVLRLVLSGYDVTDFTDRTGVGDLENTLSTLVFREDNRDYHRREGFSVGVEADWRDQLLARLEYRSDEYSSLGRIVRAGWGGREDFLPNPAVDEGLMRSLLVRMRLGSDLHHAWIVWELSNPAFSSDYEFQQLMLGYRSRAQLGRDHYLDLRVRWGGNLAGTLPTQKRYVLGGIGTVRGYRYQSLLEGADGEFGGEQMVLATAEYVLGVQEEVQLALFLDSGMAYADRKADLDPSSWSSSAGLGIVFGEEDGFRLDLIKTLDGGSDDLVLQGRLGRAF